VLLASILSVAHDVGYPVLFILIAIETMGVPVPGETALFTAGILAARGHLSIEAVIPIAAAAAIVGDNVGFTIGRRLGRRLLLAGGPFWRHRIRLVEAGEPFFERHGPKAVFLGRWIAGLRITSAWLAGVNRMAWPTFLFWNALGGIAWALSVALLAYFLGRGAERVVQTLGLGAAIAVVAAGLVAWIVVRRRQARQAAAPARRRGRD
jgi:membrane protein DedA with SNARE-associated domain